ncbi:unnamed protein product [Adineta steineri]|uniref:Uncharacterized protein n=1 Tax=Adineta steineri TaxID=433720 RepID=A0A818TCL5_9BILA|nr:unnamed protein product [Adineta steineri]CAF3678074.1 unnamed protein product [Adineta steineri]
MSSNSINDEIIRLQNIGKKTLRQMSNSIFLIGSFLGSLVSLWSSRYPRSILNITGVDPLVGSIVFFMLFMHMIILGTFSILTWYNLRSTRQNRQINHLQQQVNRMMLTEFALAFLTTLPNFVYNIYLQITQSMIKSQLRLAQESCLYIIVSRPYRRNIRTALCFRKQNQVTSHETQLQRGTTIQTFP